MINRATHHAKAALAFTPLEIDLLHRLQLPSVQQKGPGSLRPRSLQAYLIQRARLGGYLNRASDPPPGNMVMWRGMSRLTDIELGYLVVKKAVGN